MRDDDNYDDDSENDTHVHFASVMRIKIKIRVMMVVMVMLSHVKNDHDLGSIRGSDRPRIPAYHIPSP